VTTPLPTGALYASIDDLKDWVSGTDAGTGTPAQLSDDQLTLCLYSASNRVSVYAGGTYDGSSDTANPPPVFHDLTLDLAAFFAWRTYLKGKVMASDHPVFIAYQNATQMLNDVRDGKITLDVATAGSVAPGQQALIINRIPPIFTGKDSNTRIGLDGVLEDDVPAGLWTPRGMGWDGGTVYQG
jgi:Bacteriophage Mu, Gp36